MPEAPWPGRVHAMTDYRLSHLQTLEAESIHILREVVAELERPVMLYSVGKDSGVLLHLARRAFSPGRIPFPLLHVDIGHKFAEMYAFRDRMVAEYGCQLIVHRNEDAWAAGVDPHSVGTQRCCSLLKTQALLDALREGGFDAAIGGARRDEERSRAKERVYSFRDEHGQWDPKHQRPEVWNLFNGRHAPGESIRVFPLSNWTEADVWDYIAVETIPVVPLYFAASRRVLVQGEQLIPADGLPVDTPGMQTLTCRFRSLGCSPCTGAVRSTATSIDEIRRETHAARSSERMTRVIDHDVDGSMEQKKLEGYF